MEVYRRTFRGNADAVPAARHFIREVLRNHELHRGQEVYRPNGAGRPGEPNACPQSDLVELACSEFFTNALHHTPSGNGGTVSVAITHQPGVIRLEVDDDGSAVPPLRPVVPDEYAESSRGLMIVNSIATRWGDDGVHGPSVREVGGSAGWHRAWAEFECPDTAVQL